jgi:broad specificity phosphatase PhoE
LRTAILVRHGESVFSVRGLLNGDTSVPGGLTPAGVEQAQALGERLRDVPIDLVVTSGLERAIETADVATAGRHLPRLVLPELNDPLYGPFEGGTLEAYRAWAVSSSSSAEPGAGGESRYAMVERYAAAFDLILGRQEDTVAVFAHSLPLAYAIAAHDGLAPGARMPLVEYATPYEFSADELAQIVAELDRWLAAPTF